MTAAPAITLPGARVLPGWWRDFSALRPHRLWFAHFLVTRVELLVEASSPAPLDTLAGALLELLARKPVPFCLDSLAVELEAAPALLARVVRDLALEGLLRPVASDSWEVDSTRLAEKRRSREMGQRERRTFLFTQGTRPVYLPLAVPATTPLSPPVEGPVDLSALEACVEQTLEWKAQCGFPTDVQRIVRPSSQPNPDDWRTIPLARADQTLLVLAELQDGGAVIGYPVRSDGWTVGSEPVLFLPCGLQALAPLLEGVGLEGWVQSWQAWCQQRSLPTAEVEACELELRGHYLRVRAPARLIERLRATRSDALKGEAWLLAGAGRIRATAQIDLAEEKTS